MKIAVLAGNREQFERGLDENGKTDSEAFYAYEPPRIFAEEFTQVVVTGTFWQRRDATEMHEYATTRARRL